jgi:hypothetical protein
MAAVAGRVWLPCYGAWHAVVPDNRPEWVTAASVWLTIVAAG